MFAFIGMFLFFSLLIILMLCFPALYVLLYRLLSGCYSWGEWRELHLHQGWAFSIILHHIQHLQQHGMDTDNNILVSISESIDIDLTDFISLWRAVWSYVCLQRTAQVPLPDSATVDTRSSSCGVNGSSPWLVAVFGPGHALGLSFSTNGSLYSVANVTLQYNLSDTSVFPGANSSGENKHLNKLSSGVQIQFVVKCG